jgi:predicted nucleic acid-binding protein
MIVVSDTSPLNYLVLTEYVGTLGILSAAAERGLIDGEEAIKRLSETSFRASPKLLRLTISRGLKRL